MKAANHMHRSRVRWPRFRLSYFAVLFAGLIAAMLSVAQSAALIGLPLEVFRSLGTAFYAWRSDQALFSEELIRVTDSRAPQELIAVGRRNLEHSPSSARAMWIVAKGLEAKGDDAGARRVMSRAQSLSRRDGAVQLWLGSDALGRRDVATGLDHFDKMLRSNPEAAQQMLPRLVAIISAPGGRAALRPYVRADNSWYDGMLAAAVQSELPAADVAELLHSAAVVPDSSNARASYRYLVWKLVEQRSYQALLQLWPKLPGAHQGAWQSIKPRARADDAAYPPVDWSFSSFGDRRAGLQNFGEGEIGIEAFASSGTTGVSASKLLRLGGRNLSFEWRVLEQAANPGASAFWQVTCVSERGDGESVRSLDLMDQAQRQRRARMSLPANCHLMRVELHMSGGIGRDGAQLLIGGIGWVETSRQ